MNPSLGQRIPGLAAWVHMKLTPEQESWSYKIARDVRVVIEGGKHGYGVNTTGIPLHGVQLFMGREGLVTETEAIRYRTPEAAHKAFVEAYARFSKDNSHIEASMEANASTYLGYNIPALSSWKHDDSIPGYDAWVYNLTRGVRVTIEGHAGDYGVSTYSIPETGVAKWLGKSGLGSASEAVRFRTPEAACKAFVTAYKKLGGNQVRVVSVETIASLVGGAVVTAAPKLPTLSDFTKSQRGDSYLYRTQKFSYTISKWTAESPWWVVRVKLGALEYFVTVNPRNGKLWFSDGHPEQYRTPEAAYKALAEAHRNWNAPVPRQATAAKQYTLHRRDDNDERRTADLPVAKRGTLVELNAFAKKNGLKFRKDSSLFGGYYVDETGITFEVE